MCQGTAILWRQHMDHADTYICLRCNTSFYVLAFSEKAVVHITWQNTVLTIVFYQNLAITLASTISVYSYNVSKYYTSIFSYYVSHYILASTIPVFINKIIYYINIELNLYQST